MDVRLLKKPDILLIIFLAVCAVCGWALPLAFGNEQGEYAAVFVKGKLLCKESLYTEKTIEIIDENGHNINTVKISGGKVFMEYADCPDKVCMNSGVVCHSGETIVCLPNKVVIEITGGTLDGVAK
ncbi:MAG: NusG domain II-containing protein [Clostridiales bacterium]|nr:NusG domain II-containing protein [Clostridiales bacterium]